MRLAHHLAQHIEAATVGHAESNLFQAELTAALDDLLQRRNHRLRAIEPEALGAGVFDIKEILEALCLNKLAEDRSLALPRELYFLVGPLDALLNPGLLRWIGNMDEFEADGPAIGPPQIASISRTVANSSPSTWSMKILRS